jgi:nucleoside-diphosphate-sugar epimerase
MGEKILITGGAGYIGSVAAEVLLDEGHEVTCLDNFSIGEDSKKSLLHLAHRPGFNFIFGDVRDRKILEKLIPQFDVIIPLAGIVGAPQCDRNPVDAVAINQDAVIACGDLITPNQKLIYPTTNSGYGTTSGDLHCDENTPLNPISLYGRTKVAAEKNLLEGGKNPITLRLATVFGMSPRMRTNLLVNDFVLKAMKDKSIVIFEGHFKRNYVPVRDVARCFAYCIKHYEEMRGKAYNVGLDNANLSKLELAEKIKEHLNFDIIPREISFDPDKRNYIVSNERLAKTGFKFEGSIEAGIPELITGYKMMFGGELG